MDNANQHERFDEGPKDLINTRILQTMISGMPLVFGLGARM